MRAAIYRRDPRLYFETGHILSAKLAFPLAIYVTRFEKIAAKIDNFPAVNYRWKIWRTWRPISIHSREYKVLHLISFIGSTCCLISLDILRTDRVNTIHFNIDSFLCFFFFSVSVLNRLVGLLEKLLEEDKENNVFCFIVFLKRDPW